MPEIEIIVKQIRRTSVFLDLDVEKDIDPLAIEHRAREEEHQHVLDQERARRRALAPQEGAQG